jgi:basic membrane protein A and related proteins
MLSRRTLLALPFGFALAGCQEPAGSPGNGPGGTSGGAGLKVGLLTTGALTDSGWNSLAGKALEQMKTELGAVTSHQSTGSAEAEEGLRGFARDGCRLVFAHGNEFSDAAKRVSEEFSSTVFVVSSGIVKGPNLASLRFDLGEASYLAGMAAAGLSRTGKAGQIGGVSIPPVKQAFELFEKGGQAINPAFTTTITYLGNWHDANAAKEKALAMIRNGADILFQNADAGGDGVFAAAEENQGVLVIGSNANQNDLKPDIIAASAVLDIPKTFMAVARDVQSGTFRGDVYLEDLKSGNVYLAINPRFEEKIPASVRKKIDQARQDILTGKLQLIQK